MKIEVYRRNLSIITDAVGKCYVFNLLLVIWFKVYKSGTNVFLNSSSNIIKYWFTGV